MKSSAFLIAYLVSKPCIAHTVRNIFSHGTLPTPHTFPWKINKNRPILGCCSALNSCHNCQKKFFKFLRVVLISALDRNRIFHQILFQQFIINNMMYIPRRDDFDKYTARDIMEKVPKVGFVSGNSRKKV